MRLIEHQRINTHAYFRKVSESNPFKRIGQVKKGYKTEDFASDVKKRIAPFLKRNFPNKRIANQ